MSVNLGRELAEHGLLKTVFADIDDNKTPRNTLEGISNLPEALVAVTR
jgi:hypothetical protein